MDSSATTNEKHSQNAVSPSHPTKGGLRTMPFIIVNECLEKVASMILYLTQQYGMAVTKGTNVIYTWTAMSNFLAILGAFLSDSYLGRFHVISLVSQLAVLFLSLGLISIGAGCIRPCSIAFGADQLTIKEGSNDERLLDSYFNWYYTSIGVSSVIALSVIVYIQENLGWKIGFGVVAVLMFISAVSFILGSPFYDKVKPCRSILSSFVQVIVVAVKNRKLSLPDSNIDHYFQDRDSDLIVPTDTFRYLNKACIIRTHETVSNPDGSVSDPWSQCTVGQVESLKSLLKVLPMWSAGIFGMVPQGLFSTLQANTMDRRLFGNFKIPAGSFTLIVVITVSIIIPFYDRIMVPLLSKYTGSPRGFSCKSRIGMGMLFVCAGMITSAIVESMRRNAAIEEGFEDQPNAVIPMSALWLVPQFVMLGIAEALNPVGQVEFFFSYIPKSMSSFASALFTLELAAANVVGSVLLNIVDKVTSVGGKESWLSTNINRDHLNYYYALLGCICLINYLYFLVIFWTYGPTPRQNLQASAGEEEDQFDYRELPTS